MNRQTRRVSTSAEREAAGQTLRRVWHSTGRWPPGRMSVSPSATPAGVPSARLSWAARAASGSEDTASGMTTSCYRSCAIPRRGVDTHQATQAGNKRETPTTRDRTAKTSRPFILPSRESWRGKERLESERIRARDHPSKHRPFGFRRAMHPMARTSYPSPEPTLAEASISRDGLAAPR
jgi:hypothetical protein